MTSVPESRELRRKGRPQRPAFLEQQGGTQYLSFDASSVQTARGEQNALETGFKLWRKRWLIVGSTLLAGAIAAVVAWSMPSLYSSETRVLVGVSSPRVLNVEAVLADVSPDAERVQDEGFVLQSRMLGRKVIDQLNLWESPDFNPALRPASFWGRYVSPLVAGLQEHLPSWMGGPSSAKPKPALSEAAARTQQENRVVDTLLSRIDVSTLGRSHVLSIKADARDPEVAASIANALAEAYLDYQRAEKINSMDRVDKFLVSRIRDLREQVRKSDQALEDYRRTYGLYKSGTGSVTTQQLTELNTQLMAAQTAKVETATRLAEAQEVRKGGLGGDSVPEVLRSPLISVLRQQQADAERRAAEISATYGEKHQLMRNARAETASLAGRIQAEVAKIVDGLARDARVAEARYTSLQESFEALKSKMGEVNDRSIQLESLERDAVVNRNLLEAVLSRAKQTMGTTDILDANAKLVSAAAPSEAPSYPPKALIVGLGALIGGLIGAAISLLVESSDRTFRRADQIEAMTGLPVMAMVPQVRGRAPIRTPLREPSSPYSEALRRLNLGIELSECETSAKTILVSSSEPGEGKSVMVASLGSLLAHSGRRVLLIDCDWRKPRLHLLFRCSNRTGLAELLGSEDTVLNDCIHHDAQSGVDVLPAGSWTPRSTQLLHSERMHQLLDIVSTGYDTILLDTPPVLLSADVLSLSRLVDKVVFVVRWGHTTKEVVMEGLKQLIDVKSDIAGVVMSRVVSKKYRQYGYGTKTTDLRRPALLRMG